MSAQDTSSRSKKSSPQGASTPLTKDLLKPFFEEMKTFVHSAVQSSAGEMKTFVHSAVQSSAEEMKTFVHSVVRSSETVLRDDLKDFVQSTVKASETVVRQEMHGLHNELQSAIHAVEVKVDLTQIAVTEHTKMLKKISATVDDHELRLTQIEQHAS